MACVVLVVRRLCLLVLSLLLLCQLFELPLIAKLQSQFSDCIVPKSSTVSSNSIALQKSTMKNHRPRRDLQRRFRVVVVEAIVLLLMTFSASTMGFGQGLRQTRWISKDPDVALKSRFCLFDSAQDDMEGISEDAQERKSFFSSRRDDEDSIERAEFLPFSSDDRRRLQQLRQRHHSNVPILIMDAMLPKQKLTFQSNDPKFRRLVDYCTTTTRNNEGDTSSSPPPPQLCMLGLNPYTGRPLCRGVTVSVTVDQMSTESKNDNNQQKDNDPVTITVIGQERMEVQGEPWLDETESFYLADVEILEGRPEIATPIQVHSATGNKDDGTKTSVVSIEQQAKGIQESCQQMPKKVTEWIQCVLQTRATTEEGLKARMMELGPMPEVSNPSSPGGATDLALWVAALINPLPSLGVCLEIRPAMLSCSNDYERIILATQAIESSIDHMNGKKRLF